MGFDLRFFACHKVLKIRDLIKKLGFLVLSLQNHTKLGPPMLRSPPRKQESMPAFYMVCLV